MRVLAVVVAAAVSLGYAGSQSSQATAAQPFCAWMFLDGCDFGDHVLQGPGPDGYDGAEAHGDCRTCVIEFPCHNSCGGLELDPEAKDAYAAAFEAAAKGDVDELLRQQRSAGRFIRVNAARSSVQLLSCDGASVIANLPAETAQRP